MPQTYSYTISKEIYNQNGYRILSAKIPYQPNIDSIDIDPKWHTISLGGNGLDDLKIGTMYTSELIPDGIPESGYHQKYVPTNFEYEYPESAEDQWKYLRYILSGSGQAYRSLLSYYGASKKILDVFANDEFPKKGIANVREKRYKRITDQVKQLKSISQFVSNFPVSSDITTGTLYKLSTLYHGPKLSAKILKKNPYMAMTLTGFGFQRAEKIRQKLLDSKVKTMSEHDPVRIGQGIAYFLDQEFSNGSTYATVKQVLGLADDLNVSGDEIIDYLKEEEQRTTVIQKSHIRTVFGLGEPLFINLRDDRISTTRLAKAEFLIYKKFYKENNPNFSGQLIPSKDWHEIVKSVIDGSQITDEQAKIFSDINNYQYAILSGPAGTGKSWVTGKIVNALKKAQVEYVLTASTAKAAKVLAEYTHENVKTVHRVIKYGTNQKNIIKSKVLVIDEASMIGSELMAEIILACSKQTSILLIGDSAQLPSVSPGNILRDLLAGQKGTTLLTKVFRQANDDGLKRELTLSRQRQFELPEGYRDGKYHKYGKDLFFRDFENDQNLADHVLWLYTQLILKKHQPIDELLIMAPMHKGVAGVDNLNAQLRNIANPQARKKVQFDLNDRVMIVKNSKAYNVENMVITKPHGNEDTGVAVFNGDTGIVAYRDDDSLIIHLDDGEYAGYDPSKLSQMQNIEYAYAVTYHKAQGSSSKNIIMAVPGGAAHMLSSNLIYTGLSRAVERAYVLGRLNLLPSGIKRTADDTRNTLLSDKIASQDYVF